MKRNVYVAMSLYILFLEVQHNTLVARTSNLQWFRNKTRAVLFVDTSMVWLGYRRHMRIRVLEEALDTLRRRCKLFSVI